MPRYFSIVAGLVLFLLTCQARADLTWGENAPKSALTIAPDQLFITACKEAEAYQAPTASTGSGKAVTPRISETDLVTCYGADSAGAWKNVSSLADKYIVSAQLYYALAGGGAPEGVCEGGSAETPDIKKAKDDLAAAQGRAEVARADLAKKQTAAGAADIKVSTQQATLDKASLNKAPAADLQKLTDELSKLKIEQDAAQKALAVALKATKDADQEVTAASATAANAKNHALTRAKSDAASARKAFHEAIDLANGAATRSPPDFEALLEDSKRLNACVSVRKARLDLLGATAAKEAFEKDEEQKKAERTAAHRADLFRKAESAVSSAFSGNGFGEQPGSPDKVVFSLMSALGADSRTTGTQLIMTLNLASLIAPNEEDRLKLSATVRSLTLRTNLPLQATDNTPLAGPATPTNPDAATPASRADVSRFTAILGSSFLDDTDQRLSTHDACYNAVLAYRPHTEMASGSQQAAHERKDYYDICNRRAVRAQRLAWRAGVGFITPKDAGAGETRPELAAGAIVWGPTQWLYANAFYQHILEPAKVRVCALGFSFGGNVGGSSSGVDSWARVGLDLVGLYTRTLATNTAPTKDDTEYRITPNVRAKILGGSVIKLGAGARILASDIEHPAILASLALTYDADALIDQALMTPGAPNL